MKSKRSVEVIKFSSVNLTPEINSVTVIRGFSKPRRKVSGAAGSRSIKSVFLPNSANATVKQCERVVFPTPPAGFEIAITFTLPAPIPSALARLCIQEAPRSHPGLHLKFCESLLVKYLLQNSAQAK